MKLALKINLHATVRMGQFFSMTIHYLSTSQHHRKVATHTLHGVLMHSHLLTQHYNFFAHHKAGTLEEYKQTSIYDFHARGNLIQIVLSKRTIKLDAQGPEQVLCTQVKPLLSFISTITPPFQAAELQKFHQTSHVIKF